jgi:hypothetical protein
MNDTLVRGVEVLVFDEWDDTVALPLDVAREVIQAAGVPAGMEIESTGMDGSFLVNVPSSFWNQYDEGDEFENMTERQGSQYIVRFTR